MLCRLSPAKNHTHFVSAYLLLLVQLFVASSGGAKKLPTLMTDDDTFYRIMSEFELLDSGKSYMQEEWVSVVKQTFRMDLIEAPNGARKTYLYDRASEEKFFYQPFVCSLITNDRTFSQVLDPEMRNFFPKSSPTFIPTGITSLWFYAQQFEADYTEAKDPDWKQRQGGGASHTLRSYSRYKIKESSDFAYKLEFYFRPRLVEESRSAALIQILDPQSERVLMRIKILEVDMSFKSSDLDKTDLFDVPPGYGCRRSEKFDPYQIEMPAYLKLNAFVESNLSPYLLRANMIASQPVNEAQPYDRWRTHTSSLKILLGRFILNQHDGQANDYLVTELEDYVPAGAVAAAAADSDTSTKIPHPVRQVRGRRIKQVWDLGSKGLNSNGGLDTKQVTLYSMDEKNGVCLANGRILRTMNDGGQLIKIPLFYQTPAEQQAQTNKMSSPTTGEALSQLDYPFLLDLFSSTSDYHLLSQKDTRLVGLQTEFVYEKRLKSPAVSIVRTDIKQRSSYSDTYKTTFSVSFFNSDFTRVLMRVVLEIIDAGPVNLAFFHQELDVCLCLDADEQRQQNDDDEEDANDDKNDSGNSNNYPLSVIKQQQGSGDNHLEFRIGYGLESEQLAMALASSYWSHVEIYEMFLRNLFEASDERLDILQVSDISMNFSEDLLEISGKFLEKPHLLSYSETRGQRIVAADRSKQLFTEIKSSGELCAQSCNHYKCTAFVYCSNSNLCDLLMGDMSVSNEDGKLGGLYKAISFEPDIDCSLFTPLAYNSDNKIRHVEPAQLVQQLHDLMLEEKFVDNAGETNSISGGGANDEQADPPSLTLVINNPLATQTVNEEGDNKEQQAAAKLLVLFPTLFQAGESLDEELEDLEDESLAANGGANTDGSSKTSPSEYSKPTTSMSGGGEKNMRKILPEYRVLFENRRFRAPVFLDTQFPLQEAMHLGYDQCELLCNELDCRSFSHCRLDGRCLISALHQPSMVEEKSLPEGFCFIVARDYLTKFTQISQTTRPILNQQQQSIKLVPGQSSSRDCASTCMEDDEFKCRSFYYCPSSEKAGSFDCYLSQKHKSEEATTDTITRCQFFVRSYLSEFDKFFEKMLPNIEEQSGNSLTLISGSTAEDCAARCATFEGKCQGFHVCRDPKGVKPVCAMVTSNNLPPANQKQPVSNNIIKPKHLIANPSCTAFILSKSSELRSFDQMDNSIGILDPDQEAGINNQSDNVHTSQNNHLIFKTFLLIFGLGSGYLIALVVDKRIYRLRL